MADEPRYPYVHVDVPADVAEAVSAELFDHGAGGIERRDRETLDGPEGDPDVTLVAYFEDDVRARAVAAELSETYSARVQYVVGDAWREAWREHFKPTHIGGRLLIRPSWEEAHDRPGDVVLTIDPGRAFGSGIHETTRLVLAEIDGLVRGDEHVLDVGCGSGILSIAAVLLGAARATAVDVDPDAVAVTRENAALNDVAGRVDASTAPVSRISGEHPLVVANIQAAVLVPMAADLVARISRGGTIILSGVLWDEREVVAAAYEAKGLRLRASPRENEWVALVMERPE